ncbi:hypothetical protein LTS10_010853 [Elasticomyces elasticus]|nr:hypothetical protein LTS10_010853 [Elasticomyces elasticus]
MTFPEIGNGTFLNGTQATGLIFQCAASLLSCPVDLVRVNNNTLQTYTCIQPQDFTYTSYKSGCDCPNLAPDPDIAGIGVVLSFIVVAIVSFILYVACMFLSMISTSSLNPMDERLRQSTTRLMSHRTTDNRKEIWLKTLTKVLLGLNDQQLITCLAVLIVAVVKLADESLTVYHFTVCVDLAWCSTAVHTMNLDVLGSYFRRRVRTAPNRANTLGQHPPTEIETDNIKKRRMPLMTTIRIVLMSICTVLLLFCLIVKSYRRWDDIYACPANCARKDLMSNYNAVTEMSRITLLLITQPVAVMLLTNAGVKFLKREARSKPTGTPAVKPGLSVATRFWILLFTILSRGVLVAYGVQQIMSDRASGHAVMKSQYVENTEVDWGFGQLVPLIFCILPFIAAGESYWDEVLAQRVDDDEEESSEPQGAIEMESVTGALQSEPAMVDASALSVHSNEFEGSTLQAGDSTVVDGPSGSSDEGSGTLSRRSTFTVGRPQRT